jgi:hypothetical protein
VNRNDFREIALVEKDIEDGRKLIEALDQADFRVHAALWFYFSDSEEWRLMIATPLVDEQGPKETYTRVQSVLAKLFKTSRFVPIHGFPQVEVSTGISLKDISVVSPKHNIIQALRAAIRTGPGISGIRLTRNAFNNVFIEDAYIYRMQ